MRERNYEFRRHLSRVHRLDRRNENVIPNDGDILVEDNWDIVIAEDRDALVLNIARDLQAYFFESMNVSLRITSKKDPGPASSSGTNVIILATREHLPDVGRDLSVPRSYRIQCLPERIVICGFDARGLGQGSYYLEDLMNLREAPVVETMDQTREPLFSPRMVHSGWGLDEFPDPHLNAIAHAGMDAILVFVEGVNRTPGGYQDFNDLVRRADQYGLDVYAYSYLKSKKHPDEPDAQEYYDQVYGEVFKNCPGFKGIVMVGESVEFPSKDPHTTGTLRSESDKDGIPRSKPTPGWWPCCDYPQWLNLIKKTVRKYSSEADIVFWTYNWGWAPEEHRLELIRNLPEDVTLLVTFEMFEEIEREKLTSRCVDYTVSFEGPGGYFTSEAAAAHERGLTLYTMSNTGGLTWDFGVIPYEPFPYQWSRRHKNLRRARETWGLSGLMESHHYGWWPSFISELAKWAYWRPSPSFEQILESIAERDFGEQAAPRVLTAWKHWSEAIRKYVPTNEDQYGPFRIGPSYPLVFRRDVEIPSAWYAMFGTRIIKTDYQASGASYGRKERGFARVDAEIESLQEMTEDLQEGIDLIQEARDLVPEEKIDSLERMLGLGRFILRSTYTTIHVKEWWKRRQKLAIEPDRNKAREILDEMKEIAEKEIANAEATIPLVKENSRLGWEPSMEYMTDPEHLRWKVRQVSSVMENL